MFAADAHAQPNQWIAYFTSTENRHALPLFTSLLNVVCAYDPVGYGMPYNHLMFSDSREPLVEAALHVLCVTLDTESGSGASMASPSEVIAGTGAGAGQRQSSDVRCSRASSLF
jgi:High-temperature-induced dauer-formation protein